MDTALLFSVSSRGEDGGSIPELRSGRLLCSRESQSDSMEPPLTSCTHLPTRKQKLKKAGRDSPTRLNFIAILHYAFCTLHYIKKPCPALIIINKGANTRATTDISLIRMLIEGPAVSLKGSPTVSPTTDAL